jgi:hypothetical protein
MAIAQNMCNSFKQELFSCYHCFTAPTLTSGTRAADTFKIALYTSTATLNNGTTVYSSTNEITNTAGTAYVAGGQSLTSAATGLSSNTAYIDFTDPQWTSASFTANGALIYNSTQQSGGFGRAVAVIAFGGDKTVSAGTFTIQLPAAGTGAIITLA